MLSNVQRLRKWPVRSSVFLILSTLVWGGAWANVEEKALERKAFIQKVRFQIEEGLRFLFPEGYKTIHVSTNLKGLSNHGKREQLVEDAKGQKHTLFIKIFYEKTPLEKRRHAVQSTQHLTGVWGYPVFLWHDPEYLVMVTEFIPHATVDASDFKGENFLSLFVQKLKISHQLLKSQDIVTTDPLLDRTKRRLKELLDVNPDLKKNLSRIERFLESFESKMDHVIHGDIQSSNILGKHSPVLIDWSNVTRGDIFEDLGSLAEQMAFDAHQEELLLKNYFGEVPANAKEKLTQYRILNRFHFGLYYLREGFKELKDKKSKTPTGRAWMYHPESLQKGMNLLKDFWEPVS